METLFGVEMPLWLKFIITMLLVLALFGAFVWGVRMFGGAGPQFDSMRGRQPRLAVIDNASVDSRRRLILIRRDNVEHLLMIGGPTDIVIEPNIVRAAPGARDAPVAQRPPLAADALPRTAPGETAAWPLQPEAPPRPQRGAQPEESEPWPAEAEHPQPAAPPPRRAARSVEALAGIAAEAARVPEPRAATPDIGDFASAFPSREGGRPRGDAARERGAEREPLRERDGPRAREASLREQALREQTPREPSLRELSEGVRERPQREAVRPREAQSASAENFNADADQNLADMAQRLEAALRRPGKQGEARAPEPRAASAEAELPQVPALRPVQGAEAKPAKSLYDSLEKEMASLLGRPSGKS